MITLQTNISGGETVNSVTKFKKLPEQLQQYIKVALYNNTYYYKWESQPDWNKLENSTIGFQVYKDYFNCLALFYKSKNGYYSSMEIGKLFNDMETIDLTAYTNCNYPISIIIKQLSEVLPVKDRRIINIK